MKTDTTVKNSEYRAIFRKGLWIAALVSIASGRVLSIVGSGFKTELEANYHIDWVKDYLKNSNLS